MTPLVAALTLLVLALARWLLALDLQAQQMVARDGTPEPKAPLQQRAQYPHQPNAHASTLDGVAAPARLPLRVRPARASFLLPHRQFDLKGCKVASSLSTTETALRLRRPVKVTIALLFQYCTRQQIVCNCAVYLSENC